MRNLMTSYHFFILFLPSILSAQNFWQPTNGPFGSSVLALAVHPNGDMYAATENNGLLRSTDNGESWERLTNGLPAFSVFWRALAINAKGHIFAGGGGIYRSMDLGETWVKTNLQQPPYALAINADGHIFAGTDNAIYRSADNGDTWTIVLMNAGKSFEELVVNSRGEIFASSSYVVNPSVLYRSTDNGQTWVQTNLSNQRIDAITVDTNNTLFAGTWNGVFRSIDNGDHWEQINNGLPDLPVLRIDALFANRNGEIWAGGDVGGIFFSDDGGNHWKKALDLFFHVTSFAASADTRIIAGCSGGIFRSSNRGRIWTQARIVSSQVMCFAESVDGSIFIGARDSQHWGGIFKLHENGSDWEPLWLTQKIFHTMFVLPDSNLLAGFSIPSIDEDGLSGIQCPEGLGGIVRSTEQGRTWRETMKNNDTFALIPHPNDEIWAGTLEGVFKSSDAGQTWVQVGLSGLRISAVHIDAHEHIFAAASKNGIVVSRDQGKTWSPTGFPQEDYDVNVIAGDAGDRIFAGTFNSGIYRSENDGVNWSKIGLDSLAVKAIVVTTTGKLYVGTHRAYDGVDSRGVLLSSNYGDHWEELNRGLPELDIYSLFIDQNGFLYAGTFRNGAWRSTEAVTAVQEPKSHYPSAFFLQQNYPNPFNPATTIQFSLPRSGDMTLKVYDASGAVVATLMSGNRRAGKYRVEWNANDFASGLYFYRLQMEGFAETRKLILLK